MATIDKVKTCLSIVGDHADALLEVHIETVLGYLRNAGVSETAIAEGKADGAVVRGVADLWNSSSGDVVLSPAFKEMATQLALCWPEKGEGTDGY